MSCTCSVNCGVQCSATCSVWCCRALHTSYSNKADAAAQLPSPYHLPALLAARRGPQREGNTATRRLKQRCFKSLLAAPPGLDYGAPMWSAHEQGGYLSAAINNHLNAPVFGASGCGVIGLYGASVGVAAHTHASLWYACSCSQVVCHGA